MNQSNVPYKQPEQPTQENGKTPRKRFPKWAIFLIVFGVFVNVCLPVIAGIVLEIQGRVNSKKESAVQLQQPPSEEDMKALNNLDASIGVIEFFYQKNGYVPDEAIADCIEEVAGHAQALVEEGKLADCSNDGCAVWMIDEYGLQTIYVPTQEDTLAFNTNEYYSIVTIEPYEGTFSETAELLSDKNAEAAVCFDGVSEQWTYTADIDTYSVTPQTVMNFGENQIILWLGHGSWSYNTGAVLVTGEYFDAERYAADSDYRTQFTAGYLAKTAGDQPRVIVTPKYITANAGSMENSVVFLGTCSSAKGPELVNAFLKKGASAVVGNSDVISVSYYTYMLETIVQNLCAKDETGQYNTFETAMRIAKETYGYTDSKHYGTRMEVYGSGAKELRISDVIGQSDPPATDPTIAQTEPATEAPTQPPSVDVHQLLVNYASQFSYLNGTTGYTGAYTKTQYRNVYSYNLPDQPIAYTIADFDQDNVEELLIADTNSDNTVKLEMYEVSGGSVICNAEIDLPTPVAGSAENGTTEYFYFYRNGALQICVSELSIADRVASGTILRCAGAIYDGSSFSYQGMAEVVGTAGDNDPFARDMAALGINNVNVYDMLSGYKLATDYISSRTVFCTARYMGTIMDGEWMTYQDVWFTDDSLTYLEISYIGFTKDLLSA